MFSGVWCGPVVVMKGYNLIIFTGFCALLFIFHEKWNIFKIKCRDELQMDHIDHMNHKDKMDHMNHKDKMDHNDHMDHDSPTAKTMARIDAIQSLCGELCDTTKVITPGQFMGSVKAEVRIMTGESGQIFKVEITSSQLSHLAKVRLEKL